MKIPIDKMRVELDEIKNRQKVRKQAGKPVKVSNETIYEMLSDILENQARQENMLRELLKQR